MKKIVLKCCNKIYRLKEKILFISNNKTQRNKKNNIYNEK